LHASILAARADGSNDEYPAFPAIETGRPAGRGVPDGRLSSLLDVHSPAFIPWYLMSGDRA
jgi:hypothetical protein